MNLFKKSLLSPAVALLICSNIYADNISYSMEKQSLKDAIEKISKKANKPYIASGEIFDGTGVWFGGQDTVQLDFEGIVKTVKVWEN